ncbi:MAG: tRNA (cytosine(32)/uridine(32)-2'-O)-methyltransferase TrmJ [Thiotrichales bacterium]|nr:tRNA (cytosine(32)/uridine(32)-2'-O)-methyltransferase TrmJ [Thiotrichales bacterium]
MSDGKGESSDTVQRLRRVRVVLVETSHPGNIGAVARAMKTMALSQLHLVSPGMFPNAQATARAAGADDLLHHAEVHDCLDSALADCSYVVATTARSRHLQWPLLIPSDCAERVALETTSGQAAIVFGRESSGLTNAELERCHAVVNIPSNPSFSSLNIASAVQILCYEIALALKAPVTALASSPDDPITSAELEGFYEHLRQTLVEIGYLDEAAPKLLMRRLRRMFSRTDLERAELNILRGILSAVQKRPSD